MNRAFTFRNPKIIKRLCEDFIPYAGNVEELQPEMGFCDFECAGWYMKMATQTQALSMQGNTTQGTYIAGADGTVYGWKNAPGISAQLHFMEEGLKAFKANPPRPVNISTRMLEAPYTRPPLPTTSVVAVYSRIRPLPRCADGRNRDVGRDYLWIYRDEVDQILRESEENTLIQKLPQTLAYRIARYYFIDGIRGQPAFWRASEVKKADFALKKLSGSAGRTYYAFDGRIECLSATGERGVTGKIAGQFTIDAASEKMITFRAYGKADAWGASEYTKMGMPEGHFPLVFAFIETSDEKSKTTPPGAVAEYSEYRHANREEIVGTWPFYSIHRR